jgi:hypothetical protein
MAAIAPARLLKIAFKVSSRRRPALLPAPQAPGEPYEPAFGAAPAPLATRRPNPYTAAISR